MGTLLFQDQRSNQLVSGIFLFFFCTSRDVKPDNILLDEQGERQAYREPWEAKGESRGVLLYARTHFPFWTMTPVALSHRTRTPD